MHPDQRSTGPALCPVCKMQMVAIPPMRVGEYRLDVALIGHAKGGPGLSGLRVSVNEPSGGKRVTAFDLAHEKSFHLFVVGRDLEFFRHLHPDQLENGSLEVREPIPPGEYIVIADFVPAGGVPQLVQRAVISPGARTAKPKPKSISPRTYDTVTNVRIEPLSSQLPVGQSADFDVVLSRTEDGRPIVNLEPYLGAGGHLLAVSEDLTEVIHAHAPVSNIPGSLLRFELTLPKPGAYAVWVQFQRPDVVLTARLTITGR